MPQPSPAGDLSDLTAEALDNPTSRMLRVLARAEELGWTAGRISLCVRLSKPDDKPDRADRAALPFYATWELAGWTPKGKPSWHFKSAAAANMQPLSESDILIYLEHPEVIYPEPPEEPVPEPEAPAGITWDRTARDASLSRNRKPQ